VPLIFRGDSHFLGRSAPAWRRILPLRLLYRQFSAVTYVGAANRAYFERLGVPSRRLFFAPHSVDRRLFDPGNSRYASAAAALRTQLGLAEQVRIVLFAGKFIPAKQPGELLQAFLGLAPPRAALVFVGDGEDRPRLEAMAHHAPAGAVHFLPFANQSEMPARYLLSGLLALPSRGAYETWGLAVNESMQMGRPALVSDRVGCQQDLVTDGETGWVFSADRPGALKSKLAEALAALADPDESARIRWNVAERIAGYGYEQAANGLLAALASLE
jgi:glycosyltransferase involved in cell wall biosynthesis